MLRSEMSDVHNTLSKTNSQYRLSFLQDELSCFHNIHVQYFVIFQNDKEEKLCSGPFISYMARNKDPWCIPTAHVGLHPTIATLILKYKCILYRHLFSLVLTHIRHMVTILYKLSEELSYSKRFMDLKGDIRWASLHVYSKINSK